MFWPSDPVNDSGMNCSSVPYTWDILGNDDSDTGLAPGLGKSAFSPPGVWSSSLIDRSDDAIEEGSGKEVRSLVTDRPSLGE